MASADPSGSCPPTSSNPSSPVPSNDAVPDGQLPCPDQLPSPGQLPDCVEIRPRDRGVPLVFDQPLCGTPRVRHPAAPYHASTLPEDSRHQLHFQFSECRSYWFTQMAPRTPIEGGTWQRVNFFATSPSDLPDGDWWMQASPHHQATTVPTFHSPQGLRSHPQLEPFIVSLMLHIPESHRQLSTEISECCWQFSMQPPPTRIAGCGEQDQVSTLPPAATVDPRSVQEEFAAGAPGPRPGTESQVRSQSPLHHPLGPGGLLQLRALPQPQLHRGLSPAQRWRSVFFSLSAIVSGLTSFPPRFPPTTALTSFPPLFCMGRRGENPEPGGFSISFEGGISGSSLLELRALQNPRLLDQSPPAAVAAAVASSGFMEPVAPASAAQDPASVVRGQGAAAVARPASATRGAADTQRPQTGNDNEDPILRTGAPAKDPNPNPSPNDQRGTPLLEDED